MEGGPKSRYRLTAIFLYEMLGQLKELRKYAPSVTREENKDTNLLNSKRS
jgi:hypothetical protein